jgi:DNA-binding transcriptional MerR regulator
MSVRVLTLFDLEPIVPPEQPVVKSKPAPAGEETEKNNAPATTETEHTPKAEKKQAARPVKKIAETQAPVEKNYYSIGETAKMFDVRTSHIRFWTVQFSLKMRTNRKGDRLYTPENIEQLKVIHHLVKEQGFTIAGAKSKLKELKGVKAEDLKKGNILDMVRALKEQLTALRKLI